MKIPVAQIVPYSYLGEQQNPHEVTQDKAWVKEIRFPCRKWGQATNPTALANPQHEMAIFLIAGVGSKKEFGIVAGSHCFIARNTLYKRVTFTDVMKKFVLPKKRTKPGHRNYRRVKPQRGLRLVRGESLIYFLKEIVISRTQLQELQDGIEID